MAGLATRQGRAGVFRVVRLLSRLWRRPPIASAAFFRPPGICEAHWYYSGNAKYSRDWVQLLGAAGVVARLDTGKAFVDIGDEAETPHLAVGDDIDAAFSLLANQTALATRRAKPSASSGSPRSLAWIICKQIGRPRHAADMSGEYSLRASLHRALPSGRTA